MHVAMPLERDESSSSTVRDLRVEFDATTSAVSTASTTTGITVKNYYLPDEPAHVLAYVRSHGSHSMVAGENARPGARVPAECATSQHDHTTTE